MRIRADLRRVGHVAGVVDADGELEVSLLVGLGVEVEEDLAGVRGHREGLQGGGGEALGDYRGDGAT